MRLGIVVLWMLLFTAVPATAQVSVGIGFPGVSIGINLPAYPQLVRVPGYPVYYAPSLNSNFFFYDGMYWVYQGDNWYASSWYNGPWGLVAPAVVPLYILRVPVRYYRQPPVYFGGWRTDAPPRWGDHWGREWEQQRGGWDRWNHSAVPAPAPLPSLPAPVRRGPLPAGGTAECAAEPELPLPAARRRSPRALQAAGQPLQLTSPAVPGGRASSATDAAVSSHREEPEGRKTQAREKRR